MAPESILDRTAVFGSVDVNGADSALTGANITRIFDSAKVDLRAAELIGAEAKLECLLFGSLELRVPAFWRVVLDVQSFFGDLRKVHRPRPNRTPRHSG